MSFKAFGKNPSGKELVKVQQSPNYREGIFHNEHSTLIMDEKLSMLKASWMFLNKPKNTVPPVALPVVRTDLHQLPGNSPVIVWFGHSSYLIHVGGKNVLVDPVFSGHASPFSFFAKSFPGTNVFTAADMPVIDLLIITHDHYDHLDYETVLQLKNRVKHIATSLGVQSHLLYWGFDPAAITELDWWQQENLPGGFTLTAAPARHFSGRSLDRFKTLWASYILEVDGYRFYIGADSGYDTHFKMIGDQYGPFDIALLETGQYNEAWRHIHMMPEEAVQAGIELKAKVMMPVHWGKFSLALHPWDEPIKRVVKKAGELGIKITTPKIGQPVVLHEGYPTEHWWEKLS